MLNRKSYRRNEKQTIGVNKFIRYLRSTAEPKGQEVAIDSQSLWRVFSLLILGFFIYLFVDKFKKTTDWEDIKVTESEKAIYEFQQDVTIQNFLVMVQFSDPLPTYKSYRSALGIYYQRNRNQTDQTGTIQPQKCQFKHFSSFSAMTREFFDSNPYLSQNLCFQIKRPIYGAEVLPRQGYVVFEIEQFHLEDEESTDYPYVSIYFIDTLFSLYQKESTSLYFKHITTYLVPDQTSQIDVYLSNYQIESEQNFLPWEEKKIKTGYYMKEQIRHVYPSKFKEQISKSIVSFGLSKRSRHIERQVKKWDEVISYIGGLYQIVVVFFAFFMLSFNEYRYELMVAEGAFNYKDDGERIREKDFHFLFYVKYAIFDWINTFCCCEAKWEDCRKVEETREEANNQLDASYMFKRIQNLERIIEFLVSEKEIIGLSLTEPPTLKETKEKRMIAEYYDKIIKGEKAPTLEDIRINTDPKSKSVEFEIVDFNSGKSFHENIRGSRANILDEAADVIKEKVDTNAELNEEEEELELKIAQALFDIPEDSRRKIQEKVPIKILIRLRERLNAEKAKSPPIELDLGL